MVSNKNIEKEKAGIFLLTDYANEKHKMGSNTVHSKLVKFSDIFVIEVDYCKEKGGKKNYLKFITMDYEEFYIRSSVPKIIQQIPSCFIQINRNTIANISAENHFSFISKNVISLSNNKPYEISRKYREDFRTQMKRLFVMKC